jgi:hypothetical protein
VVRPLGTGTITVTAPACEPAAVVVIEATQM